VSTEDSDEPAPTAPGLHEAVARRLLDEPEAVRRTVAFLGALFADASSGLETPVDFACRHLGVDANDLISETFESSHVFAASVGAVLNDLIEAHAPAVGPGSNEDRPSWRYLDLAGQKLSVPHQVSLYFAPGSLTEAGVVVRLAEHAWDSQKMVLAVETPTTSHTSGRKALDLILERARGERNLYRGTCVRAEMRGGELAFQQIPTPEVQRDELVLPTAVWTELDLNVSALTTHASLMSQLDLGSRRGILLTGPPGVGKTAVTRQLAAELVGEFTVIIADAQASGQMLPEIFRETVELGRSVVILEDIDLYLGDRKGRQGAGRALADFLAVMDGAERYDDVLTLATTNDPHVLDKAAVRSARFDTIIEIGYPDRVAAAAILRRYLARLDSAATVDVTRVASALPGDVSGADLREIVRRTALTYGPSFTTGDMLDAVSAGRWRPATLTGEYL